MPLYVLSVKPAVTKESNKLRTDMSLPTEYACNWLLLYIHILQILNGAIYSYLCLQPKVSLALVFKFKSC